MMHRPASTEILKSGESYYSLVMAVAKRAREIAEDAEEQGKELLEKPVQVAVEEFAKGKYKLIEQDRSGKDTEILK